MELSARHFVLLLTLTKLHYTDQFNTKYAVVSIQRVILLTQAQPNPAYIRSFVTQLHKIPVLSPILWCLPHFSIAFFCLCPVSNLPSTRSARWGGNTLVLDNVSAEWLFVQGIPKRHPVWHIAGSVKECWLAAVAIIHNGHVVGAQSQSNIEFQVSGRSLYHIVVGSCLGLVAHDEVFRLTSGIVVFLSTTTRLVIHNLPINILINNIVKYINF